MQFSIILSILLIALSSAQNTKISRSKGNILRNLQETQEFEDHIVTSNLDNPGLMRMLYRGLREIYGTVFSNTGTRRHDSTHFQKKIPQNIPFPCETRGFRSRVRPSSVHKLMPGDIDIIAALGDSLTSATAANSANILEVLVENRGLSWCIGGQGNEKLILDKND